MYSFLPRRTAYLGIVAFGRAHYGRSLLSQHLIRSVIRLQNLLRPLSFTNKEISESLRIAQHCVGVEFVVAFVPRARVLQSTPMLPRSIYWQS